jgi:metallophosphoesterase (TIGR03767 family)
MAITPTGSGFRKVYPNQLGWRPLEAIVCKEGRDSISSLIRKPLLNLIHISDTHICDAQSPARVEYLDRYADPHHPASSFLGTLVGTYRAHEILTTQVLESMVQSMNMVDHAPLSGAFIDAVLITGDLTDNAQINELKWAATLLSGGILTPDSGSSNLWEGPGGTFYSPFFWNPHGTPAGEKEDFPRYLYGYPTIPELLDAVRAPFIATGLTHEYLMVHGNHDALLQGTVAPDLFLRKLATSEEKIFQLSDEEALRALREVTEIGPARYPEPLTATSHKITPDLERDFVDEYLWQKQFELPSHSGNEKPIRYWSKDFDNLTLIALDTVNPFGGWQGSIDQEQFIWLKDELEKKSLRYVVITSHHPIQTLVNGYSNETGPRVLSDDIKSLLIEKPNVIAWICGHNHRNRIEYFGPSPEKGFWQIETASLIDWPQQGRVIEIFLDSTDQLGIASTPIEHQGLVASNYAKLPLDDVNTLAGLSRVLSLNDWQRREGAFAIEHNEGRELDRYGVVWLPNRLKI